MALRIAFAHVLAPNLKWLILDEPTHNIDQQGITKMLRLFNEVLPEMMEQIFVITHDEQLKQISNGKVYSLTRNKDEGKETEAIEI
jgi:energy-coupling factor transporter ATP-binding protein EcfA2